MICPKCNAQLMEGAKFCGSCGLVLEAAPQQQSAGPQPGGAFNFDKDGRGQGRGYTWAIEHQGAFALAVVHLQPDQTIAAEAGAMVSMSANIDLHSEMKGGVFGALKRAVIQMRNLAAFAGMLKPFFPSQGSGSGFSFGN